MALAISQTDYANYIIPRKAAVQLRMQECEFDKLNLMTRQSNEERDYQSKLKSCKSLSYYANGNYNKVNYNFLMGNGCKTLNLLYKNPEMLKTENSMILTDVNGLVVIGNDYLEAMKNVLGASCVNSKGRGTTFSSDKIPELIAEVMENAMSADDIRKVINGETLESSYSATTVNTATLEATGSTTVDNSSATTDVYQKIIDFYYPIFQAAASNGWTTEYNKEMERNSGYVDAALQEGFFQLANVDEYGYYEPDTSLQYFINMGDIEQRDDAHTKELLRSEHEENQDRLREEETMIDLLLEDYSAEYEALTAQEESYKSLIQDGLKTFEWCA